ncbi:AAA family ATPase [Lactobacillaceae bacterium Melli_B4]
MTEINVGGDVQDNQYSTLEEAVKNSKDGDVINIHEPIEIYDTIIIDHAININGYKNNIKVSNMIMGFYIELFDESTVVNLSNMNIIVGENGSFIQGEDDFECTLELDSINITHEKLDPETYSLSINTNSNFGYDLTIKNSHIDGIFTKSYKVSIEDSTIGTPLTLTSKIVGTTNNIKNSQLNNIYIIERGVRNAVVHLDNVSTIGALGIRGSLELNGFTVDPLPKDYHSIHGYISEEDELTWNEVAKRFKAKRDVPALLVYNFPPKDLYYLLDVSLTDLKFPVYEEQGDVFANTNWLYLVNCKTIIKDSVIPETIKSNNIQQSGTLKYLNSSDDSEWTRKNVNDESANNDDDSTNDSSPNNGDEFFEDLDYYNPLRPINNLVGIPDVKKSIVKLVNLADLNDMRTKNGLTTTPMNIIFEGNNGSGKKTVAVLFQEALYKSGLIKEDKFINALSSDIGRDNISRFIEDAANGVLYIQKIDELVNNNNITILEFTNAIKAVKNDTVIIISGNPNRLETFLKNAGADLSKLFLNKVRFNDYNLEELVGIFDYNLAHQSNNGQFIFTDEAKQLTHDLIKSLYNSNQIDNNGTFICNELMNNIINEQASRLANLNVADIDSEDVRVINETDIKNTSDKLLVRTGEDSISGSNDALEDLNALIGLKSVKQEIKDSINLTRINRKRKEFRLPSQSTTMNMMFLGNPGTGKTTVARLYGKAMFQHGVLNKDKFTEVNAKDLVSEYVGQTAIKTHNLVMSALDGVLFIDEAYMLASQGTSFNEEAVAQLLTDVEDNRDSLVVIMAGYTKQINDFISSSNPGIPSRFPIKIEFPDYNSDELVEIFNYECKKRQLSMDEATLESIRNGIKHYLNEDSNDSIHSDNSLISKTEKYFHKKANKSNGNARFIRNFMDNLIKYQSRRLAMDDDLNVSISDLTTITLEDANKAISDLLKVN